MKNKYAEINGIMMPVVPSNYEAIKIALKKANLTTVKLYEDASGVEYKVLSNEVLMWYKNSNELKIEDIS